MQKRIIDPTALQEAMKRLHSIMEEHGPVRTQAASEYLMAFQRLTLLNGWLFALIDFVTKNEELWRKSFLQQSQAVEGNEAEISSLFDDYLFGTQQDKFQPYIYEMMFCKLTDAFLSYVTDILFTVYQTKPAMLKASKEMMTYEFAFQFDNMDDLITAVIDKKVNELSYKGVRELASYCKDRGIVLFESDDELEMVIYAVETRNILVHNKGVVNDMFKTRLPKRRIEIGSRVVVDLLGFLDAAMALTSVVVKTDARVCKAFGIERSASIDAVEQTDAERDAGTPLQSSPDDEDSYVLKV